MIVTSTPMKYPKDAKYLVGDHQGKTSQANQMFFFFGHCPNYPNTSKEIWVSIYHFRDCCMGKKGQKSRAFLVTESESPNNFPDRYCFFL